MISEDELREIQERADKATRGPWKTDGSVTGWLSGTAPAVAVRWEPQENSFWPVCMCQPHLSGPYGVAGTLKPVEDADFIANARTDIPTLLAAVRGLQRENAILAQLAQNGSEFMAEANRAIHDLRAQLAQAKGGN